MAGPRSPTEAPLSGAQPVDPRSIPALAAALLTCRHPEFARVSAEVLVDGEPARLSWCAACGSLGSHQPDGSTAWQPSACAGGLTEAALRDLSRLLHSIRRLEALVSAPGTVIDPALLALASELASNAAVQDVDRIDDAIVLLSTSAPDPAR